ADETVEIINPDHIIATMTDDVPFLVEMTVENGRGYRTADENAGKEREIGVIPVDSSFSPVVRVKYEIEETRVGQRTNYDKLVIRNDQQLLEVRNFGETTLREVKAKLQERGLALGMKMPAARRV